MTTDIKKAAESVMQGFVHDFARECNPAGYRYSYNAYCDYLRDRRETAKDYIHGATILMITSGNASANEYHCFSDQIDAIEKRYHAEFQGKPEQPA
jgi:hypothetical protein